MKGTLDNLIPWEPGQSGNPNGRPKKELSMTEGIRDYLHEMDPEQKKLRRDILIEKATSMAARGDSEMIKYLINRLDGMPKQQTDVTTGGEKITPIYGGQSAIPGHNSNEEDIQPPQAD